MFKKILFGLAALLAVLIAAVFLFAKDFTIQISETTVQEAIDAQVARDAVKYLGVEISPEEATIDFRDDNTAAISAKFDAVAFGYPRQVDGTFQSGIRYTAPRLYLNNITPIEVDIKVAEETQSELNELKSTARKFLERQRDSFKSEKNAETLDKIIGDNAEDFQKSIVAGTYKFFELIPVYDLNSAGYKGSLASLALKDVTFSEDYVTVTLSPVQAMVKILGMIGIGLLTVLYLGHEFFIRAALSKVVEVADGAKEKPEKTISGYVDVPPGDRADFALALPEHTRLTNAEPGCQYFRVTPDPKIEGRYQVEERFDDQAAYDFHAERTAKTKWARITRNIKRSYTTD